MQYNPLTQELYSDDGTFLKKLYCPLSKQWEELIVLSNIDSKLCKQCNKAVYDTSKMDDSQLQELIFTTPQACLKVDLNQNNLTLTYQTNGK